MEMLAETGWSLKSGLELVRLLQPDTRKFNYHLTLGGGVLNKGLSKKDIDLFFLPMDNGVPPEPDKLLDWLASMWGDGEKLGIKKKLGDDFVWGGNSFNVTTTTISPNSTTNYITFVSSNGTQTRVAIPNGMSAGDVAAEMNANPGQPAYVDNPNSVYKYKMKFKYGQERIDVFIL